MYPFVGVSFFPRTDAGQFVINVKAPTGTRIELTDEYVKKVEDIVRQVVRPSDLNTIVSNIGVMPDLSALFTPNSGMHTAFVRGGTQGRSQGQQLRLHGGGARAHRQGNAGAAHLLSVRRPGGCGAEPGRARADRRPGQRDGSGSRQRHSLRIWPASSRRFREYRTSTCPRIWIIPACR